MRSRLPERRRRGGEVGANEAPQGVRPDARGGGVPAGADGEQVAVVDIGRAGSGGERLRGAAAEGGVARAHRADGAGLAHARGAGRRADVHHGRRLEVDRQRPEPSERRLGRQCGAGHGRPRTAGVGRARDNGRVTFTRIAWLVTVVACVVTGVALLVSGYQGYAAVFGAVGACAAINLR